jgi:hypothetical protein
VYVGQGLPTRSPAPDSCRGFRHTPFLACRTGQVWEPELAGQARLVRRLSARKGCGWTPSLLTSGTFSCGAGAVLLVFVPWVGVRGLLDFGALTRMEFDAPNAKALA